MPLSRASSTRPRVVCDWWPSRCRPTMSNILHSREENFTEPFKEVGTLHASTPNLTLSTVYLGGHLQYEQTSSSFLCTQCMGVATRQLLIHMPGLLYSLCHYLPVLCTFFFPPPVKIFPDATTVHIAVSSHHSSTGISLFHCKTFYSASASQIVSICGN